MEKSYANVGRSTPPSLEDELSLLPDSEPVTMPVLPTCLTISTEQQFKAISDTVRSRILGVVQYQPLTAKQIAQRLQATPGAIGHHLHVLEEAGLVRVVARRLTRGIVASYYTRTARVFYYDLPKDVSGPTLGANLIAKAHAEFLEAIVSNEADPLLMDGFPHVRVSQARMQELQKRLNDLLDEIFDEPPDPAGEVYSILFALFKAPSYLQVSEPPSDQEEPRI
jgi:DNA-binding transcriptional ArsR family regulator